MRALSGSKACSLNHFWCASAVPSGTKTSIPTTALADTLLLKTADTVTVSCAATFAGSTVAVDAKVVIPVGLWGWPCVCAVGVTTEAEVTVTRLTMPSSSSQVTPSATARRRSMYVPGVAGARILNVKVPIPPGATFGSVCTATRSAVGQPAASDTCERSSPATPRLT